MRITRLELKRFKRHHSFELEPAPGLTVIRGPNESGKSTIVEAVLAAFFVGPTATKEAERTTEWGMDQKPWLAMHIEDEQGPAVIEKDFERKKSAVRCEDKVISSSKKVNDWIEERLGFGSSELFRATACIYESEVSLEHLDMKSSTAKEILDRLQALLTGAAGGSPSQVISRLTKRLNDLKRGPTKTVPEGGPVFAVRKKLEKAQEELERTRQNRKQWDLAAAELERLDSRIGQVESEKTEIQSAIGNHRLYLEAEKNHRDLAERLNRFLKAEALFRELREMEKEIAEFEGYERLEPALARLNEIEEERKSGENELMVLSFDKYENKEKMSGWSAALLPAAAVAAVAGGAVFGFLELWWPLVAGAASAVGLAGLYIFQRTRTARGEKKRLARLESKISETEESIKSLETELSGLLERFGKDSVEESRKSFQAFRELRAGISDRRERIADLTGEGMTEDDVKARTRELSLELRGEKERMESLEPFRIADPVRYSSLEEQSRRLEDEYQRLLQERSATEARMTALDFDAEELAVLEEEESALAERLSYWERELRVHEKALQVLQESSDAIVERAGEVIEKEVSPSIFAFTAGRYEKVKADRMLRLFLYSSRLSGWIGEDELSSATREQLQLAVRLALVKLVSKDRNPPVILDDPFSHYDPQRVEAAMQVIKEFSQTFQVILLSPDDRYSPYADRVIELGPPV
ncbi:MAG: AAA family ATPase [bacterium]